ncbi:MAG: hypothetical protein HY914_14525 [Desulfomonile tiedjei]|nr:hypothetical protein [Desulfomonile tiedjei]
MQQQIGIELAISGTPSVLSQLQTLEAAFARFEGKLSGLTARMGGLFSGTHTNGFHRLSTSARQFGQQVDAVSSKVGALQKHLSNLKMHPPGGAGPGGAPQGAAVVRGGTQSPWGMGATGFWGRWMGLTAAASAGSRAMGNMVLGTEREKIAPELRDLAAISLDRKQRTAVELQAQAFTRKYPAGSTIKDYMSAYSEAGSSFSIDHPAFKNKGLLELGKMTQASLVLGASSKMPASQAAETLMGAVHAVQAQMSAKERESYDTGQKSYSGLTEKIAAQLTKAIEVSSAWGKDFKYGFSYSLPTMLQAGWKLENLVGVLGAAKTAGYTGQRSSRALKSIFEGETTDLAKLMFTGHSDPAVAEKFMNLSNAQRKQLAQSMAPVIRQKLSQDPFGTLGELGALIKKTEDRKIGIVERLGITKEFIGQLRTFTSPSFLKSAREVSDASGAIETLDEAKARLEEVGKDTAYTSARLTEGMSAFWQNITREGGALNRTGAEMAGMFWSMSSAKTSDEQVDAALRFAWEGLARGLYAGTVDMVAAFASNVSKKLGVLPQNYEPAKTEDLLQAVTGIPQVWGEAIDSSLQIVKQVETLGKSLSESLSSIKERAASAASTITSLPGKAAGALSDSITDSAAALTPSFDPFAGLVPEGATAGPIASKQAAAAEYASPMGSGPSVATPAPAEAPQVHVEAPQVQVDVKIGERDITDIVKDYVHTQMIVHGETFGTSSLGGSSWAMC